MAARRQVASDAGKGLDGLDDATRRDCHGPSTTMEVSAPVYALVWWIVLAFHAATATFVLVGAMVHLVLSLPTVHASTASLLIPVALKRATGSAYLLVGLLHLAAVGRMVVVSVRPRGVQLQLFKRATMRSISTRSKARQLDRSTSTLRSSAAAPVRTRFTRLRQAVSRVFGTDGYFGVHGSFFLPTLMARELVEVLMQSYQLWSLSYYVSRAWINRFAVATVVLNCFSIPLVRLLFRRRRECVRRLMHLVADMYLDFACAVVVPVCVLLPYLRAFDWAKGALPAHLLLDDVWIANAVAEARHVLVTTYPDFMASLLPQYSIYTCLRLVKQLVQRQHDAHTRQVVVLSLDADANKRDAIRPSQSPAGLLPQPRPTRASWWGLRIVSSCIMAWGVTLSGLHLATEHSAALVEFPGCQLYVRPWLTTKVACSVLFINCYRRGIGGDGAATGAVLDQIEPSVLTKLVFMHCPALTVPSTIVGFFSLGSVEIVNSTLVDWPTQASIRQETHPRMVDLFISSSTVSGVPHGLLHRDLPLSMLTIGFTNCTIAALPSDLGELWATSRLGRIALDSTQIRTFPESLGRLRYSRLWMARTPIESFPDGVFVNSKLRAIRLSSMPLQRLPENVGDTTTLQELVVEHTNVSRLPAWAVAWLETHQATSDAAPRSFFGSPVCDSTDGVLKTRWRICERELQPRDGPVQGSRGTNRYPL